MGNGSWKTWALGISGALLMFCLTGAGWAYTNMSARVDSLQASQSGHGERIARLEEALMGIRQDLQEIKEQLHEALRRR